MARAKSTVLGAVNGKLGSVVVYQSNGQTIIRARASQVRRGPIRAEDPRRDAMELGALWRSLSPERQLAWTRTGERLAFVGGDDAGGAKGGYQTFFGVNSCRRAQGLDDLRDAPETPFLPGFLPPLTLTATAGAGGPSLTVNGGGYANAIAVYAARPVLPGAAMPAEKRQVRLCVLPGLPAGGVDIGADYARRCGRVVAGQVVWLRLVPLSAMGFRGPTSALTAFVGESVPR